MTFRQPPMVSKKLREAAKDQPCVCCGKVDGSTVLAHRNIPGNFGMGMKCDDWFGAHLCGTKSFLHDSGCHAYGDSAEGRNDSRWWELQIWRTQRRLFEFGVVKVV